MIIIKFFQQKNGMDMGSSLLPVVKNIFTEYFEKLAVVLAQHKPPMWLRYVDDTFVVWPLMAQSGYRISSAASTV
jgi:hypothetical protein